jgi:imidazole glycerol phosphate synthase subunit HisF
MLYHLKDKGVGAICLESIDTDFSLKEIKEGSTNAVIRQTGIFLYENGGVGTMQHLDLAT